MAGAIATAYVKLIPTFDKQLSSTISKQLGGVDGKAAGSKVGKLFSRGVDSGMGNLKTAMTSRFSAATVALGNVAARAITGAMSTVASSMDSAISRVDTMNNFPRIMEGMGIGADAAQASIRRLSDGIDGLPTALDYAVSGVTRFTSKNDDIGKSTDYFLAVNNAIAAGGQSMELQSTALEQLSQSYSKGKMDMMEWRSLQTAMPAQLNQVAQAMGMTADELGEGLRNGSVSMDEFMDKIVELNEKGVDGLDSFAKQARKATGGIGTAMTNVRNRINKAMAGIVDAIGQENIAGAIDAFSSKFGKIGKIIGGVDSETGEVLGFIGGLKDGLASALEGWEPQLDIDWDSMFQGAMQAAKDFGEWLSGPLSTIVKTTDSTLARLGEAWDNTIGKLDLPDIDWSAVSDGISAAIEALAGFSADVLIGAMETIAQLGSDIQAVFGPFAESIAPAFESMATAAGDFLAPIGEFVTGNGPVFQSTMESISSSIQAMAPFADSLGEHINNIARALEPLAGPAGSAVVEALSGALRNAAAAATVLMWMLDRVAERIDQLVTLGSNVANAFSGAAGGISGSWNPLLGVFNLVAQSVGNVTNKVNEVPESKTTHIYAEDHASGVLGGILGQLAGIAAGATAVVTAVASGSGGGSFASGGISLGAITVPRHADGGISGIVSRPLLTNIGLVGEAGAEAIIPLDNKRYVRPFARAVASEMGGTGTVENHYTINLQYEAGADATDLVYGIARGIKMTNLMEA